MTSFTSLRSTFSSRALESTVSGRAPVSTRIRWPSLSTSAAKPHSPMPSSASMVERIVTFRVLIWACAGWVDCARRGARPAWRVSTPTRMRFSIFDRIGGNCTPACQRGRTPRSAPRTREPGAPLLGRLRGQAQFGEHDVKNFGVSLRWGAAGVDHGHAVGIALGDGEVSVTHAGEKGAALLLEAVFVFLGAAILRRSLVAAAGAFDAGGDVGVHEDGEIGLQVVAQDAVEFEHGFTSELAAGSLIGLSGIGEAVAEYDFALRHRGCDDFVDVLGARGEHQRHLGHRSEACSGRVENDVADFLSGGRAARFARYDDRDAARAQRPGEFFDLRAFAGAVEPFEGDELAAMRGGHGKIVNQRLVVGRRSSVVGRRSSVVGVRNSWWAIWLSGMK